jgi:hypothetical protein
MANPLKCFNCFGKSMPEVVSNERDQKAILWRCLDCGKVMGVPDWGPSAREPVHTWGMPWTSADEREWRKQTEPARKGLPVFAAIAVLLALIGWFFLG